MRPRKKKKKKTPGPLNTLNSRKLPLYYKLFLLPHIYLHEQNTQLFFSINNLYLFFFPVYIISNWFIHWGFQTFSSVCCLIPHNLFYWFSLFTSPSFSYAGSFFKASVLQSSMLSLCIWSHSSDPSPCY